ncbi:MAG: serine/threonine protein kinase [Acidobacteria bacterium]|nr:MAG: serine/threonine protein kinase [Acidobacteriota bacterium]REK04048.1 MAG: serine/threonine protein kinase [Acidobacteriota bacterium]REK15210.1 MAG: serine/threonine protein kinase [Acidobacteriota bacterium]REK46300.1 MAG: serine/threonine protein kinase [Acidobacteriota bacterium]
MPEIDRNKVNEILERVLEMEPAMRQEFLSGPGISKEIADEVENLLSFEDEAESSFNLAAIEYSRDFLESGNGVPVGQVVDVYRITGELGSGGMGSVFLAERIDGRFEQKVALKLLKRELNTSALRARFQQEREILASLEHPGIARLLNAGTSEDGIPFLAMEYVDGLPIDEYCDLNSLDLDKRLDMFTMVCDAVGFAHRNLIVHRDLKPSNILVDKEGVPKLLDFGISKILGDRLGGADMATVTRMGVMTPSYASPEQLQKQSVTTAADIYSLGVILYELLCGVRPFQQKEDDMRAILEAVVHELPTLPSETARLRESGMPQPDGVEAGGGRSSTRIAGDRTAPSSTTRTNPEILKIRWQQLKGDLDNIVLKALKKEPELRYSTAERLAEDISRFLKGLPVSARPDTLSYRAGKFIRRNSVAVVAGFLVVVAVLVGVAATLWQARQTQIEAEKARAETVKTKKALDFLGSILNFANPFWNSPNPDRKRQATIAEAMEIAVRNVEKDLADEPEVQAEVFFILGKAYLGKGDYQISADLLRRSIEKYDRIRGPENLRSMKIRGNLGDHLYLQGKYDEAASSYRQSIDFLRPRLEEDEETKLFLAGALNGLGNVYDIWGRYDESVEVKKEAISIAERFEGEDRKMIPVLLSNLGFSYLSLGLLEEAAENFEKALVEVRSRGSVGTIDEAGILRDLGKVSLAKGELSEAEASIRKGYETYAKALGEGSFYTLDTANWLARVYLERAETEKAERLLTRTLEAERESYPDGNILTSFTMSLLGEIDTRRGNLKAGESKHREALEFMTVTFKEPNPHIASIRTRLASNLIAQERPEEVRGELEKAFKALTKTKGPNHPETTDVEKELERLSVYK